MTQAKFDVLCRHCQIKHVNRPRGLCWDCYYAPGVREMYPVSESKHAYVGPDVVDLPTARFDWREETPSVVVEPVKAIPEDRLLIPRAEYDRPKSLGADQRLGSYRSRRSTRTVEKAVVCKRRTRKVHHE